MYGFLDDDSKLHKTEIDEAQVLGSTDEQGFLKLIGKKCEAFVATDDNKLRKGLTKMLQEVRHIQPMNAVHLKANISKKANMGYGNFIDSDMVMVSGGVCRQPLLVAGAGLTLAWILRLGILCKSVWAAKLEQGSRSKMRCSLGQA